MERVPLDYIWTTNNYGNPIRLFNLNPGSHAISYDYFVFPEESNFNDLKKNHGNGFGNEGYDKRVFINISSIL